LAQENSILLLALIAGLATVFAALRALQANLRGGASR